MMDIITYAKTSKLENRFDGLFEIDKSDNLFDKTTVLSGYFNQSNSNTGRIETATNASYTYVPIEGAGRYSWEYAKDSYGTTYGLKVLLYDKDKNYIKYITGTLDSTNDRILHFSITQSDLTNAVYFGFSVRNARLDDVMIVKSEIYPTEYIPYYNNGERISSDILSIVEIVPKSDNLFNKNGAIKEQVALNVSTGEETTSNSQSTQYIPFEGVGTYYCLYPQNYYGQSNIKLCLYDDGLNYLRSVSGTKTVSENTPNPCYFSISSSDAASVAYIGYTFKSDTINTAMFVKSTTYPSEYIPYYSSYKNLSKKILVQEKSFPQGEVNPLYGKKAVFDGDSICSGSTTGGWAKYIGDKNGMEYANVGVAGGTITAGTTSGGSNRHWVSRYIDTIHSNYPTLDYLILEGGTNDADLLTDEEIGTLDQANFTTFDDETFTGAMESLFYKATNYYPAAKIGFIIAQRMGTWDGYGYEADDSPSNRRRRKFFEVAINVCKKWGIPYIDLWQGSPLCPKLLCYYDSSKTAEENIAAGKAYTDGQHLTQVGYNIISPKIEAWMKTL